MTERPTTGMLPADHPMAECRLCGHWSYMAGVLDDPVCLVCRRVANEHVTDAEEHAANGRRPSDGD